MESSSGSMELSLCHVPSTLLAPLNILYGLVLLCRHSAFSSCHLLLQGPDDVPGRLVMGTRCGDLDPAVVLYIQNATGRGPQDMDRLFNKESGLLGLAGKSDIRAILAESAQGNDRANLAMNVSQLACNLCATWRAVRRT